ncbi:MAG: hypothetical protein ACI379_02785 [Nocardioides sp.]|uniref:hypothetical protein n=1 Tax=Nocardioides sp. TaxID=35761 RepID=UPI003F0F0E93
MEQQAPDGRDQAGRRGPVRSWMVAHPEDVIDVFVYVVVLNLAVEYLPRVISETFTLSLLTAVLLKLSLEVVLVVKGVVLARFRGAESQGTKVLFGVALWVVAAGSKMVVLGLVDRAFGGAVSLGGFWSVTALVVVLLLSRASVRRLLYGGPGTPVSQQ